MLTMTNRILMEVSHMPRRISSSQLRSELRQAQAKNRQAVQRYNSEVRKHNAEQKRRVDHYNRAVHTHNSRLRENRRRLQSALQRLSRQSVTVRLTSLHQSSISLSTAYERLNEGDADPFLSDLAERETANSVSVLNALLGEDEDADNSVGDLKTSRITGSLSSFSQDLGSRWSGALFALDPANSDAARHFCTSSREIIAEILDVEAPNEKVLASYPDCQVTEHGTPTRRAKVQYCLDRKGLSNEYLESFIEVNIRNLTILFRDLNSGAHGPAGKFTLDQLGMIKSRVEDSIDFIYQIVS